ncbi:alcohol dehydrogenase catalytic domain-containing protein [Streptomyces sp. NPDC006393]|uniref:alcohol dehydrogenase catalytic domain-containing protein n=1 Tax=Streptomyces sp. NPDC006393 TaxID=3156763 RepID=UPI00340A6F3E
MSGVPAVTGADEHEGLPTTMRAMVLDEFGGEFRLEHRPVPRPGHGEVLVRCLAVGVGITNELARNGVLGGSVPRVHGHELAGEIVSLGSGVHGWSLGEHVTTSFYLLCHRCEWCASGRETLCENFGGFIGVAVDGAFADYVVLPGSNLVRIPGGVSLRDAGIVGDAVATPYHVVTERLRMRAGQRIAVLGAGGGLGVHMLQMIRAFGGVAIAVETSQQKADEIERRGIADAVFVPHGQAWAGQVRDVADGAVAGVVDTVATSATLDEGYRALGRAGTLVALGHVPGSELPIDPERLLLEELVVTGTRYATRAEIARTMELVRLGRVEPIVGARFPFERLEDALRRARDAEVFGRIMLDVAVG